MNIIQPNNSVYVLLQAIKSFSICPGKQHLTLVFPHMADSIQRFKQDSIYNGAHISNEDILTSALISDGSSELFEGYHTYVTLAPTANR